MFRKKGGITATVFLGIFPRECVSYKRYSIGEKKGVRGP